MANKKTNRWDTFNKAYLSTSSMVPSWVPFTALAGMLLFALFAAAVVSNQTDIVNAVGKSDVSMDFLWRFLKTNMWCKIWLGLMLLCFLVVMACWVLTPFIMGLIALIPVQKPDGMLSEERTDQFAPQGECATKGISFEEKEARIVEDQKDDNKEEVLNGPISIDKESFKKLFSEDMTEEKINELCSRMYEKASSYSKRNYGQLAFIIMFQSRYCSTEGKYIQTRQGNKIGCFSPYCQDFYSAIGLTPSSLDKGYYETTNTVVLDDFKDILEIKS